MACHDVLVQVGFLREAPDAASFLRVGAGEGARTSVCPQVVEEVVQFDESFFACAVVALKESFLTRRSRIAVLEDAEVA